MEDNILIHYDGSNKNYHKIFNKLYFMKNKIFSLQLKFIVGNVRGYRGMMEKVTKDNIIYN